MKFLKFSQNKFPKLGPASKQTILKREDKKILEEKMPLDNFLG